ncbi:MULTISPECIES: YitT family protein [unclassified Shimia]|uniref:YitT family protein n=1 Tax=unclassified Shimia TaxID=2630038 RepID=UPI003105A11A
MKHETSQQHNILEDAQGILVGTLLVALAVQFLQISGLFTGQIAGLSLVASRATGLSFATLFFLFNLPFYLVAYYRMGWWFTVKTFVSVAFLSIWTALLPGLISFQEPDTLTAAILAGVTSGTGLIVLFRHGATLGGVGIVAVWLQDAKGIKAGYVQLGFDVLVFALAVSFFDVEAVIFSLIGAAIANIMIATNHRRDRYVAQ